MPWTVDEESSARLQSALQGLPDSPDWHRLRRQAEELSLVPGFDQLLTLDANTIKELPHQIEIALQVLRRMGGRAILADEVGLGKTVEAGLILKELSVRGLARSVLILTPASLVDQWRGELESKFFEEFDTPSHPDDWSRCLRGIVSHDRARRSGHARSILQRAWDLVIVDEAHKVKNHLSATYKLIAEIERNFVLLLTATPLQNNLRELYNLVNLIRPGQLGTWKDFQKKYVARGDPRVAKNPEALRELTSQVMVRTRRASVAAILDLPPRQTHHPRIELTSAERQLYNSTSSLLRDLYRDGFFVPSEAEDEEDYSRKRRRTGKGILILELMRLLQRLTSSPIALAESLQTLAAGELVTPEYRLRAKELAQQARETGPSAKLQFLSDYLARLDDRAIVYSEHLPTVEQLVGCVTDLGRPAFRFKGDLSRAERSRTLAAFRAEPRGVLVTTRSGGEGLNLQFCHVLVNFELPWNPMVVEQRIGRVHRIGQNRPVQITSLAAQDTIEQHILFLLAQKIKLFELVVGELDAILGELGGAEKLEVRLADAWLGAASDTEFERELDKLGDEIVASREVGLAQERLASDFAGEDNAGRLEREFAQLSGPGRVRLGLGTRHLQLARGVEAKREALGLHVSDLFEVTERAEASPWTGPTEYGPLHRLRGTTARGRLVELLAQLDRLPMTLVDLAATPEPAGEKRSPFG